MLLFISSRREALQRADQHIGPGEDVRLRHQRLPGGLRGQNNGRRLQTLHGGKTQTKSQNQKCILDFFFKETM